MTVFNRIGVFQRPDGPVEEPWMTALQDLPPGLTHLKLIATAASSWTPLAGMRACAADGVLTSAVPDDRLILTDCAPGALIGRIGGSSASLKVATAPDAASGESKPFAVGRYAVVKLPANAIGPLFLGFNILFRPIRLNALEVEISGGQAG